MPLKALFLVIFHTHQNKCTVHTDNTTVYTFSEGSVSNLSFIIKLIDTCICVWI